MTPRTYRLVSALTALTTLTLTACGDAEPGRTPTNTPEAVSSEASDASGDATATVAEDTAGPLAPIFICLIFFSS